MQFFRNILIICCICVLSGCAGNTRRERDTCVVGTMAAGSGIGSVASVGLGTVTGLMGGALASVFLCGKNTPEHVADSDNDGVSDANDACPNTPAGVDVDGRGCPRDDDGDGVANYNDKCPDTPRGITVDNRGCPLDDDNDGVVNNRDECPGTPQGTKVDSKGCPEAAETAVVLHDVNFAFDSSALDESSRTALDRAARIIKQQHLSLGIVGHTDSIGSAAYNQALSERRAEAVRAYLVAAGVDKASLIASGKGENSPVASNQTPDGRAKNRRVEFVIAK